MVWGLWPDGYARLVVFGNSSFAQQDAPALRETYIRFEENAKTVTVKPVRQSSGIRRETARPANPEADRASLYRAPFERNGHGDRIRGRRRDGHRRTAA